VLESEQDRWFVWVPVFLGVGIWLYFELHVEPGIALALLPLLAAVATRTLLREGLLAVVLPSVLMAVAAGFAVGKVRTELVAAPVLEKRLPDADVTGTVERVEPRGGDSQRITIAVDSIAGLPAESTPRRLRVRNRIAAAALQPGMRVLLKASLVPPPIPSYPGGYDFARAAYFQGLGAVGYTIAPITVLESTRAAPAWVAFRQALARLRQEIGRRVAVALPGESGAIANALITGERGAISNDTNTAFRDSGLAHILAISGLHMTIMAGFVFLSIRLVLAAVPAIALRFPIKKWAAVLAACAALGYLLISGASHATLRSWIMMSIMFLAVLLDRPAITMRNVALAALAILVVLPESLFDVGFQMSFAAVIGLVAAYEALREQRQDGHRARRGGLFWGAVLFFGGIVLSTVVASLAVAPIAAYHFHKSQLFAVLANLFAVPICNIIVMPMALLALLAMPFGLEAWPLWLMGLGIDWMSASARWVAAMPGAVVRLPTMPTAAFALMVLGGLWFALWRRQWRWLGLILVAAGVAVAPTARHPDVLVGRDGRLVAVRGDDGLLSAKGARGASFELERWLENDGDGRPAQAVLAGRAFNCDDAGCIAIVKGRRVALVRHPAALRQDCRRADVVIAGPWVANGCSPRGLLIDAQSIARGGTHAIYLDPQTEVETVTGRRGERPWTAGRPKEHGPGQ
jgi:competence protein ComEC